MAAYGQVSSWMLLLFFAMHWHTSASSYYGTSHRLNLLYESGDPYFTSYANVTCQQNIATVKFNNATECLAGCSKGCFCALTRSTVVSDCPEDDSSYESSISYSTHVRNIPYPFDIRHLSFGGILNTIMSQAFLPFAESLLSIELYALSLQFFYPGVFDGLHRLEYLDLDLNCITEFVPGVFSNAFTGRQVLYQFPPAPGLIGQLTGLKELALQVNDLSVLRSNTFQNQTELLNLDLEANVLQFLAEDVFHSLQKLRFLNLVRNKLTRIQSDLFLYCTNLVYVAFSDNPLKWIEPNALTRLDKTVRIHVKDFRTCCFVTSGAKCVSARKRSPFLSCKRLLQYDGLRIVIGVVGLLSLIGNIFGFCIKYKHREDNSIQSFLITNLALSDMCMGIYLLTLLSADIYYTDYFPSFSDSWRSSYVCKLAGALSVLSSEASTFFITLITFDRFMGIKYTFSDYRLGRKNTRRVVALLWIVALAISAATLALPLTNPDVYDVSEICVGLPLSRRNVIAVNNTLYRTTDEWPIFALDEGTYYEITGTVVASFLSIATFTVLNPLCFFVVGYCYLAIFISARQSSKRTGRVGGQANEELRMAIKISLLVLTDFCCWVPLGILSVLVQSDVVVLDPVAYAWFATFVLPLNSAINPFFYSLGSYISKKVADRNDRAAALAAAAAAVRSRRRNQAWPP